MDDWLFNQIITVTVFFPLSQAKFMCEYSHFLWEEKQTLNVQIYKELTNEVIYFLHV